MVSLVSAVVTLSHYPLPNCVGHGDVNSGDLKGRYLAAFAKAGSCEVAACVGPELTACLRRDVRGVTEIASLPTACSDQGALCPA